MTFKQLWTTIKTVWQSRPFALILPLIALAIYWWTHGHTWTAASFPSMNEWAAGTALLFTKFGRVLAVFVGEADPATLPPPVVQPLLKPSGDVPKGPLVALLLGFSLLGLNGCATVQPIINDVTTCAGPACADIATKILPAVEVVIVCDAGAGFTSGSLPACAQDGLAALAAAIGVDGWRIVGCITNALEKDLTKPPSERARATAARTLAARRAFGR